MVPDELQQVVPLHVIVVFEEASAHDVEQHVGEVAHGALPVARELQSIRPSHKGAQVFSTFPQGRFELLLQAAWFMQRADQGHHLGWTLVHLGCQIPALCAVVFEVQDAMNKIRAPLSP